MFVKGQSGNPAGKKKGSFSMVTIMKKLLERKVDFPDPLTKQPSKKRIAEIIIYKLVYKAMHEGDMRAIKEILERIDGKVMQPVENELSVKPGTSLNLQDEQTTEMLKQVWRRQIDIQSDSK